MKCVHLLILLFCISLIGEAASAQENKEDTGLLSLRTWMGYSRSSVVFLGKTDNAETSIFGLGIRKFLKSTADFDIYYTVDFIPHLYFKYPKRDDGDRIHSAKGVAVSPVGFEFEKLVKQHLALKLSTSGSFVVMDTTFPTNKGRKLNFTFDISPALSFKVAEPFSLIMGYKFHHISNAQTGKENPGVDSNFLFLSLQFD